MEKNPRDELLEAINKLKKTKHIYPEMGNISHGEFVLMFMISHIVEEKSVSSDELGVKISELSGHLHMSNPAASKMLSSLEDKGLIERKMGKNDRRVVYAALTPPGNELMQQYKKRFLEMSDLIVDRLGEEETKSLIIIINHLCEILEQIKSESSK